MPLYQYRCDQGHEQEEIRLVMFRDSVSKCKVCGGWLDRAHDLEVPSVRSDLEPRFDQSTGAWITSRQDLRKQLALHNAASDELPTNSYPSAGRLCKEERKELSDAGNSLFNNRNKPGWGQPSVNEGSDEIEIAVEGKADYQEMRDNIKKQHVAKQQEGR